jgi:MFS family permease
MLRFPRPIYILVIGTFINRLGFFVLPFLALYLTQLGYSTRQIALALGSYGLGTVVASVVGGHLADTLGRRPTIVASMIGCARS